MFSLTDKYHEPEKEIEKLKDLLKYLVHVLKHELDVSDLKEKKVIHSKYIDEHFIKPLIYDMHSVRDLTGFVLGICISNQMTQKGNALSKYAFDVEVGMII